MAKGATSTAGATSPHDYDRTFAEREEPVVSLTKTTSSDLAVRNADTNAVATLSENRESLLGLFDSAALDAAIRQSGWTLAEEVRVLKDIFDGIPAPGSDEPIDPRVRLAARKDFRQLAFDIAVMNNLVRGPKPARETDKITVTADVAAITKLLPRTRQLLEAADTRGEIIDVQPETYEPQTRQQNESNQRGNPDGRRPCDDSAELRELHSVVSEGAAGRDAAIVDEPPVREATGS